MAVVSVIANHFDNSILPSGYLGVDIFFVISGFVITSSLADRHSVNFCEFILGFYTRRVRRLLPALLLFVSITGILICLFDPEPSLSLKTGRMSLFGMSNLYLYRNYTDYFARSTELNVFVHTWSLGVEEQFYCLFPFLVWLTGFRRRTHNGTKTLSWLIGALSVASLISFIYCYRQEPSSYFLMPTRLWELCAGCLLFVRLKKSNKLIFDLENSPPLLIIIGIIGVLLLPLRFAILATVAVVTLTAILIACVRSGSAGYNLLTRQSIRYIGLISYSLYLWHWGVISLSRWTIGIHFWSVPVQIAAMLMLSIVSYHYVETPLRRSQWSAVRWRCIGYGMAASATASVLLFLLTMSALRGDLYMGSVNSMAAGYSMNREKISVSECNIYKDGINATSISEACGFGTQIDRPTLFLLGDSHIQQFKNEIAALARQANYNLRVVWGNSCLFPASITIVSPHVDPGCVHLQSLVEQALLGGVKSGDVIFIGNALYARFWADWDGGIQKYLLPTGEPLSNADAANRYSSAVKELADKLVSKGAKVVLYLNSAQFSNLKSGELCEPQWFRPSWAVVSDCQIEKLTYLRRRDELFGWMSKWSDGNHRLVWDGMDASTCNDDGNCIAEHYSDSNHFKQYYAAIIFRKFSSLNPMLFSNVR